MRYLVVDLFKEWILQSRPELRNVAIVGGNSSDPEFEVIREFYPNSEIYFYGIEDPNRDNNFCFLDLDLDFDSQSQLKQFDLVICSQVLEHVWNISNAFNVLKILMKKQAYLWINAPASNFPHGSPNYFSAGYSNEFISKNLESRGFEIVFSKVFGSQRNYFMTHILRQWVSRSEHDHPLTRYKFQPGTRMGVIKKFLFEIPGRILSLFFSKKITDKLTFATESIVLARLKR